MGLVIDNEEWIGRGAHFGRVVPVTSHRQTGYSFTDVGSLMTQQRRRSKWWQ